MDIPSQIRINHTREMTFGFIWFVLILVFMTLFFRSLDTKLDAICEQIECVEVE